MFLHGILHCLLSGRKRSYPCSRQCLLLDRRSQIINIKLWGRMLFAVVPLQVSSNKEGIVTRCFQKDYTQTCHERQREMVCVSASRLRHLWELGIKILLSHRQQWESRARISRQSHGNKERMLHQKTYRWETREMREPIQRLSRRGHVSSQRLLCWLWHHIPSENLILCSSKPSQCVLKNGLLLKMEFGKTSEKR